MTTARFISCLTHPSRSAARHGRLLRAVVGAVVAAALALALAQPAAAATRGFNVCNYTSYTMTVAFTPSGEGAFDGPGAGAPAKDSQMAPASCQHFEVGFRALMNTTGEVLYNLYRDGQVIRGSLSHFTFTVDGLGGSSTGCNVYNSARIVASGCSGNENTIQITEPAGTVINIPAGQDQRQATVLHELCGASGVQCEFTPTSETKVDSPSHQVGNALINNTDERQRTSVKTADTVSETNSLEVKVEAEAKIAKVVKLSISAKYGHEWTTEHTFEQEVEVECPAHHKCWITATSPMLRDKGDFKIVLRNTTWNLPGVTFDSPDPSGNGAYSVESSALSARERATRAQRFAAPTRVRDAYTLPRAAHRNKIARPRLMVAVAGPPSHPADPAAGVTRHRIVLARTHPRKRVVHRVRDVRVVARVASRQARNWQHSRRWKFERLSAFGRRGALHLRADPPSRTHGRLCVTVRATARHARSARDRHCHRAGSRPT